MNIIIQLIEVIILKRRPSDVTFDPTAAALAICASAATSYFQVVFANVFSNALTYIIAQTLLSAIVIFGILSLAQKKERLIQTYTALFGVSAILQFVSLIILQVPVLSVFGLLITIWNFYLMILILKEAIDCTLLQSIFLTLGYHFIIGFVLLSLFPEMFEQMQSILINTQES